MQGTILADTNATVENVAFSNDLFDNAMSNAAMGSPPSTANWRFDHLTSVQTPANALGKGASRFFLAGSGFGVSNSVVYGGNIHRPSGTSGSRNCAYATSGDTSARTGPTTNPQFATNVGSYADTTSLDQLMHTDFTLQAASPCAGKGSSIAPAAQLLNQ